MLEFRDVTPLILKHLPPSADLPNVSACDAVSQRWAQSLQQQGHITLSEQQASDGVLASDLACAAEAVQRLRPNGRAIFVLPNTADVSSEEVVRTLTSTGFVRILIEAILDETCILARGERPTEQLHPVERIAAIAGETSGRVEAIEPELAAQQYRALHVLVQQAPPTRGWAESINVTWRAVTVRDMQIDRVVLLAFTSLVKAVAFMQPAVVAGVIHSINKLPRYEVVNLIKWGLPVIVNPAFEVLRADNRFGWESPALEIDPETALKGHE